MAESKNPFEIDFDSYILQSEPEQQENGKLWQTAIGLQQVDGLQTSDYLLSTARQHIEGDITIGEAKMLIDSYYQSHSNRKEIETGRTEEADKVAARITELLSEKSFTLSPTQLISIHRRLFEGIYKFAGRIRDYNITKKEWVLRGETVFYADYDTISATLDYDINTEKSFSYQGVNVEAAISHLTHFCSNLWQIHAFGEGNTRTTAVFMIKYLRTLGFQVANEVFAEHSWYFRNALVRANYRNMAKGIDPDMSFLNKFFRNLLLGEHHELKNRYMLINPPEEWKPKDNEENSDRPSTDQVPTKLTDYVTEPEGRLIKAIGTNELSVKKLMDAIGLKQRRNFMVNYIEPSIKDGLVTLLYPESPRHPRQKYKLTVKGLAIFQELESD